MHSQIIIIGAGPIGLATAVGLVQKGVKVTIIEKAKELSNYPKASTIHPPTMEILNEWGLYQQIKEIGKIIHKVQFWDRLKENIISEFDYRMLSDITKFPFRLHLDQYYLSKIFYEYLLNNELAEFRFNTELMDLEQRNESVFIQVKSETGMETLSSSYLIGADGLSSSVRKLSGISYDGYTNAGHHLLMGLKHYQLSNKYPGLGPVAMFLDENEWVDIITNIDMLKVIVPVEKNQIDSINDDFVHSKINEIGVVEEGYNLFYYTVYKTHQLVAENMVKDRVIILGDAAHVNVEFGGMGMNSGIHDAYLLVDRLTSSDNYHAQRQALKDFENRRLTINREFVQKSTKQNTSLIRSVEQQAIDLQKTSQNPFLSKEFLLRSSMLAGFRYMLDDSNFHINQ
ncbi:FAD-dependent oxidoreductase [Niallia sp. JL1B1071]|uniref:FAD-dependent oxidoreductase n=1 Tax=Niallia tiangongensis TaxID=3237105 RepID=UPI0037DCD0C4